MTDITDKRFQDERSARAHLEKVRWPKGAICPHCETVGRASRIKGKSARPGLWFCNSCRKQFSVTVGTLFERSKVPLHKWLLAVHMLTSSKKGMSAKQLERMLGVTYKTAWFMSHRIREAMVPVGDDDAPLGGVNKAVEVDEAYVGGKSRGRRPDGKHMGVYGKKPVISLVERNGRVKSYHVAKVNAANLFPILKTQIWPSTRLMTDEAPRYRNIGKRYSSHQTVQHGIGEYVRGDAYTNTVEGFFSIMKRGINGVYQHVSEAHLQRYLAEFDFRYNQREALGVNDIERTDKVLSGIGGKRLTYRRPDEAQDGQTAP